MDRRIPRTKMAAFLSLMVVVAMSVACKSQQKVTIHWAKQPIAIDGKIDDWKGIPAALFEDNRTLLAISNDAHKLYVHLRTRDPQVARMIRMTGITLSLNRKGNQARDFILRFKDGPSMRELREMADQPVDRQGRGRDRGRPDRGGDRFMQAGLDSSRQFTCFVKDRIVEKSIPSDGGEGPAAAFDTSRSFFSYEFSIPLMEGGLRYYGLGVKPGEEIGIGIEWGDAPGMNRPDPEYGGSSVGFGGSGGRKGGIRPGGPGGDRPGGARRMMPQETEIWLKGILADEPSA